jgi:predicted RNA binding protein YcfA (HicA-like mRNA interferase family)
MGGIHTVKLSQLRNFLKHYGFVQERQKGSHLIFDRAGFSHPVPIPDMVRKFVFIPVIK